MAELPTSNTPLHRQIQRVARNLHNVGIERTPTEVAGIIGEIIVEQTGSYRDSTFRRFVAQCSGSVALTIALREFIREKAL